ncbi:recombinase family protein [Candidatus Cryosericum terrychapinii]|uniref:Recombinase domain-containing protein n=1 Tax=Candidatus Cryosericum terrychapinii TaxID=2290919 RepID=A0A398D0J8_9BACT|nr:hypothetical protein SMC7_00155 [Candidatus Cryosericum terrychapinii]
MGILAMQVPPFACVLVRLQDKDISRHLVATEAQCDNEKRIDNCTEGMIATVEAGRYIWLASLRYVNGRVKGIRSLELDESRTVSLIQRSFGLIDAGLTVTKALQQIRSEGLTCRTGHELSRNTFRSMLMNKVYVDYVVSFARAVRGDFDPIVSDDVFYRVQSKLHRKWVRDERNRVKSRIVFLKQENETIIQKSIHHVIPDAMVKEWLEKASAEEEVLKCQLALVADSALDTPEVLKRGFEILGDLGSFWEESNLTTRQYLQEFVFPRGVTAGKSKFGTVPRVLQLWNRPESVTVVAAGGFEPSTLRV